MDGYRTSGWTSMSLRACSRHFFAGGRYGSARYNRAHLRHLSSGLPDEFRAGHQAPLKIMPGPGIQALRRLLYCGEWIQSHALHIYLLQAPDFFGMESAVELAGK